MRRVDDTKYLKYFARRRAKSIWSAKNKKTVDALREKKLMTELGEQAVAAAKKSGMWDARPDSVADEQELVEAFAKKLAGFSPAYENFLKLSPSAKRAQTRRHLSFKGEEARQRDFVKIIDMLNAM
ncbi:MAG: YdeI/OmpD-associated family protein [Phycisphaerae bacterium]|nr:YdeI/OmpD-associated family protein [Phycisphaerae bacterium]